MNIFSLVCVNLKRTARTVNPFCKRKRLNKTPKIGSTLVDLLPSLQDQLLWKELADTILPPYISIFISRKSKKSNQQNLSPATAD